MDGHGDFKQAFPNHGVMDVILELQTTSFLWMFRETTIFYVKIWNHQVKVW